MKTKYVPRVNQLDAIQLDGDIANIIREQLTKALQNLSPGLLSSFQPELDLLLRTVVWQYSVYRKYATFGQQLLLICYDSDQMTRSKLALHFCINVLLRYAKDCATLRYTNVRQVQTIVQHTETIMVFASFWNFFRFLRTGKRPSVTDWLLSLDHISMFGNKRRDVGYACMTRELIWDAFMDLLGFTLPLVNYHSVKRRLRDIVNFSKRPIGDGSSSGEIRPSLTVHTKCAFCYESVTLPHHMGCAHIFCYYCLKGNIMADSNFQCPLCDWNGKNLRPL